MRYDNPNLVGKDCAKLVDGDVVVAGNLVQDEPHTRLACHGRAVTFINCNMANVEPWPEMKTERCSHLDKHYDMHPQEDVSTDEEEIASELFNLEKRFGQTRVKTAVATQYDLEEKKVVELPAVER